MIVSWQRLVAKAHAKYVADGGTVDKADFERAVFLYADYFKYLIRTGTFLYFRIKHIGEFVPANGRIRMMWKVIREKIINLKAKPWDIEAFKSLDRHVRTTEQIKQKYFPQGYPDPIEIREAEREGSKTDDVGEV